MKKIEIVGGGLAGLSLGVALRGRGVPVRIREAGSYPRHRVCGEFINGVTEETLVNLGVEKVFEDAFRHGKTRWWMGDARILEAELPRPAFGMSRWVMDERLRLLFEELGGELETQVRVDRRAQPGLVWAAGRISNKKSDWLGLKAHFTGVELSGYLEMHVGEGGYLGLTPVHEGVNVCGLFRRRQGMSPPLMLSYLQACRLGGLADRLAAGTMNEASLTGVSAFALGEQDYENDLCVLGDAERMIPPFTGNGMSMAFEAAEVAVEPLVEWAQGKGSWAQCRSEIKEGLEERFSSRVNLASHLHHFLLHPWGKVGLSAAARSGVLPFQWLHRRLS